MTKHMKQWKEALANMYMEGVRVSGRNLTLSEVRSAFEMGFDEGVKSAVERCAQIAGPVDESLAGVLLRLKPTEKKR